MPPTTKKPAKKATPVKKAAVKNAAVKAPAKKVAPKKVAPKKAAPKKAAVKMHGPRADLGAPIDGFFAKQPPAMRAIADALRALIDEVAPNAASSIKWGMPFYTLGGETLCAIGAHKAHVNLILSGPEGAFDDPKGLLSGEGKTGRHLKLTRVEDIPRDAVRGWLKSVVKRAGAKA